MNSWFVNCQLYACLFRTATTSEFIWKKFLWKPQNCPRSDLTVSIEIFLRIKLFWRDNYFNLQKIVFFIISIKITELTNSSVWLYGLYRNLWNTIILKFKYWSSVVKSSGRNSTMPKLHFPNKFFFFRFCQLAMLPSTTKNKGGWMRRC